MIRGFFRNYFLLIVGILLSFYFVYHIFYGKRGYFYLVKVREDKAQAQVVADEMDTHKKKMENKVQQLSNESLNLDLIDEMARLRLNMADRDDYIIVEQSL